MSTGSAHGPEVAWMARPSRLTGEISIFALAHRQADGVDPHFGHTAGVAAGAMPVVLDYLTGAAFRFQPRRVDATLGAGPGAANDGSRWPVEGLLPRRPAAARTARRPFGSEVGGCRWMKTAHSAAAAPSPVCAASRCPAQPAATW